MASAWSRSAASTPTSWEREVLARVQRGDRTAFAELVDQFSATVYGVALRITGDPIPAARVTVTVFEDLWRRPHQIGATPIRGGLRTLIARRARLAALRRRREDHGRPHDRVRVVWGPNPDDLELPDRSESRYAEALRRRTLACLERLAPADRRILEAVGIDGDSIVEAAAEMPLPVDVAAARLTAALRRLAALDDSLTSVGGSLGARQ